jgi:hypothetical protein
MTRYIFTDNATSTLAATANAGGTSLVLHAGDGAKFPAPSTVGDVFTLRLGSDAANEVVTCSSRSTDTVTCSALVNTWPGTTTVVLTLPSVVAASFLQRYEAYGTMFGVLSATQFGAI